MGVGEQRVRVVAGELRGRRLSAPKGTTTRPTSDRVREALFSSLASIAGPDLGGGNALDAFAGSGALGIEALSRGVSSAVFIERDRKALAVLRANVASLELDSRGRIMSVDVFSLADRAVAGAPFSLILLDPPYTLDPTEVGRLLSGLVSTGSVAPGALVTWEHDIGVKSAWPAGFEVHARKRYGSTEVDIAIFEEGEQAS